MSIFTPDGLSVEHRAFIGAHGGERVVAVRPSIVRALKGHASAAILLSQFVWWANQTRDLDGWFWPDQKQLMDETGLSEEQQARARKALWALGLGEEKRVGLPAKLHYRLDLAAVIALIIEAERSRNQDSALPGIFTPHSAESLPRESRNLYKDARAVQRKEELKEELKESAAPARPREATELPIDSQPPVAFDPPPDVDPLLAEVLRVTGTALRREMGAITALERADLKKLLEYLAASNRAAPDVAEYARRLPAFFNKASPTPPTFRAMLQNFDRVMAMDNTPAPAAQGVTHARFLTARQIADRDRMAIIERYNATFGS